MNTVENKVEESVVNTNVAKVTTMQSIGELLMKQRVQIEKALPKHLTPDRMLRIIMTEIKKVPKLAACTPASLIASILQCSQLGLEPGGVLGHAYLIPFNNKSKSNIECQFILGYRGMIDLARRSGHVLIISAREVYGNDKFSYEFGFNEHCMHVPAIGDRGEFFGAYVVVHMKDGGRQFDFMTKHEIEKIRNKSADYNNWVKYGKSGKSPIWETNFDEMAKKTVVRRIFKYLPISIEIQNAVGLDEAADRGEQDNTNIFDNEFESMEKSSPPSSKSDELADKITIQ